MGDVGLEVAPECLWIAKVEPSVEVHAQLVVVNANLAVETFALKPAVEVNLVDGGA